MDKEQEIQKEGTEQVPANNTDQVGENNPSGEGQDEKVTISKKELEILQKKSEDFERSIELKRLAKLNKTETNNGGQKSDEVISELVEKVDKLTQEIEGTRTIQKNQALQEAYKEFVGEYKFANNEQVFSKISESFSIDGLNTKQEIFDRLKAIAISKFPSEVEKAIADKVKSKAFAEVSNINTGGGAGGASENAFAKGGETEEEKIAKSFYKNFPPGFAINKKLNK